MADTPMNADLTLLIQTYNRPERILAFVRALQNEDLSGIEVIIVDNGSTTPMEYLSQEIDKLPGARLVRREKNCICVHCSKSSVGLATSAFILNPGDDDQIVPGALQKLRQKIILAPNFDVLITSMDVINQNGLKTGTNFPLSKELLGKPELLLSRLLKENIIAWPSTVFRPEMFMKLSEYNFNYRTSLDWAFWILNSPNVKFANTDLCVVQYLRHDQNESSVVLGNQQLGESISMRIRALSNPALRSYLQSLSDIQAELLINSIISKSGLVVNAESNKFLMTLLIQSLSDHNQQAWEPYLMGLSMIPWNSDSFEITHHGKGNVKNYWLGYPYNLAIDQVSCLGKYERSLLESLGYIELNKTQTISFTCQCRMAQVNDSVVIDCTRLEFLNLNELSAHVLQRASEKYSSFENSVFVGVELTLVLWYRKLKNLLPLPLIIQLRKFLRR
jgi:glycosyltransferase involved in cell wall biosynthesis